MLTGILAGDLIKVPLEGEDKEEVFEELISLLLSKGKIDDYDGALAAILEREEQQTTGIGGGLAVPHGRMDSIDGPIGAMGISAEGIEFEAIDDEPVHVVFLLLAKAGDPGGTIQTLAEFAKIFSDRAFYDRLCETNTAEDVLRLLTNREMEVL